MTPEDCGALICILPADPWNSTPVQWCLKHQRIHRLYLTGNVADMPDWFTDPADDKTSR